MINCPICLSEKYSTFTACPEDFESYAEITNRYVVMRCLKCEGLYLDPPPSTSEISKFYPKDYMSKRAAGPLLLRMKKLWDKRSAMNFLKKYGADSLILDFGCGNGEFVSLLEDCGATNVCGYDPMPKELTSIKKYSSLDEISSEAFDVIRMNDTIEHLSELDASLHGIRGLLKPGGVIVGSTPNSANLSSYIFGRYWGLLHFPYYTMIFSPSGLRGAALRNGFSKVSVSKTLVPSCWAFTFKHYIKKILGENSRGHLPIYPLLLVLAAPFLILDVLFSKVTSQMHFVIKK